MYVIDSTPGQPVILHNEMTSLEKEGRDEITL